MRINKPTSNPQFNKRTFGFLTLGIGSYFSTHYYHTSLLLVAGPLRLQVDVPSPYCKILAEATSKVGMKLTPRDVDHFICTHIHGDHSNGCEDVALYKYFIEHNRPKLYVLPEVAPVLWRNKLFGTLGILTDEMCNPFPKECKLEDFFDVEPVKPEKPVVIGDVTMSIRRTKHSVPCYAMKFERNGRMLGYSCDTIYDPGLIEWLSECDLIFHETTPSGPHTHYDELVALDTPIKKKMVMIHMADNFLNDDPHLRVAKQGAFYEVK